MQKFEKLLQSSFKAVLKEAVCNAVLKLYQSGLYIIK
jgi:hypothetical protein